MPTHQSRCAQSHGHFGEFAHAKSHRRRQRLFAIAFVIVGGRGEHVTRRIQRLHLPSHWSHSRPSRQVSQPQNSQCTSPSLGPSARSRCRSSCASLQYLSRGAGGGAAGRRGRAPHPRHDESQQARAPFAVRAGSMPLAAAVVRKRRGLGVRKSRKISGALHSSASSVDEHTLKRRRSGAVRRPRGRGWAQGQRGPALAPARGSDSVPQ